MPARRSIYKSRYLEISTIGLSGDEYSDHVERGDGSLTLSIHASYSSREAKTVLLAQRADHGLHERFMEGIDFDPD